MRRFVFILTLLILCAATFAVRCWNLRDVFVDGRIYFADPDCYSRMTRARLVDAGHGLFQRRHDFENFPAGTTPHTTAPLDWLIVLLKGMLGAVFRISNVGRDSVLRVELLDVAGAIVSPLCGAALGGWLVWVLGRMRGLPRSAAWAAGIFGAVSPILVHGTVLGRPDHQSLQLVVLAVALGAELKLCGELSRRWSLVAGVAWALACWVSFYEPLILFAVVLAFWVVAERGRFVARACRDGWIAFGAIVVLTTLLEGWRIALPDATMREFFIRWTSGIGELHHASFALVMSWLGWLGVAAPLLLAWAARARPPAKLAGTECDDADQAVGPSPWPALLILALLLTLAGLSVWQVRWGYFLGLVFALALPWLFAAFRRAWIAWPVFLIALWPVARDWEHHLFPDDDKLTQLAMQRREAAELRDVAEQLRGPERAGFLAPWWLSPAIAYWSGQPGVAGSSHESLPGIVDAARFFLAVTPAEAAEILRRRDVRAVVTDIPEHVLPVSSQTLGRPALHDALGAVLGAEEPKAPRFLVEPPRGDSRPGASEAPFYRLYRVDTAQLTPPVRGGK